MKYNNIALAGFLLNFAFGVNFVYASLPTDDDTSSLSSYDSSSTLDTTRTIIESPESQLIAFGQELTPISEYETDFSNIERSASAPLPKTTGGLEIERPNSVIPVVSVSDPEDELSSITSDDFSSISSFDTNSSFDSSSSNNSGDSEEAHLNDLQLQNIPRWVA